ncbi:hypothetical protein FH608_024020 [Nonomuraea phyllanthi]|uniref:Uncharacterized protein n=1 Tax=Nonomuraea phyllanthi TaxID=2219224 RepID=A0A5C4WB75_9ACTN|nr:hypothetical protein [Nonomuraea phyllanthi]KAB8192573.1 hypothetical protein FH608_024020 [Nonomuraea phyllanthi]QFY08050.1 hypothetical protein GBF35_16405 [Nonomuraea phyllanthi]
MFPRFALAAAALAVMLAPSPALAQPSDGWHDEAHWGSVTVSADRKHITVCDLKADGLSVRAEYATTYLQTWTVVDANGARPGCGTDTTFLSRITVFKLCQVHPFDTCLPSVWISRSTLR